jgi:hypothetical protein
LACGGCSSGPKPIEPPDVDPENLSAKLIEDYDRDGNESLSAAELEKVRSLRDRFDVFDDDNNDQLTVDELKAGLSRIFDGRTGLMGASCRVTRNGKPFSGAYVYFVPEEFFDGALQEASGATGQNGVARLSIRREDLPPNAPQQDGLVRAGLYFVEVKHPTIKVPEQYNAKTVHGKEISAEITIGPPIEIPLKF